MVSFSRSHGLLVAAATLLFSASSVFAQPRSVKSPANVFENGARACLRKNSVTAARPVERAKVLELETYRFVASSAKCPSGYKSVATFATPELVQSITQNFINQNPSIVAGPVGPQGAKGDTGAQGERGLAGVAGPIGPKGEQGQIGPMGLQGLKGDAGPQGPIGITGAKGDTGATGPAGAVGPQGPVGPQGVQGIQGIPGVLGGFEQRWNQSSTIFRDVVNVWGVGASSGSGECSYGSAVPISSHFQYNPIDGSGYGYTFLCVP